MSRYSFGNKNYIRISVCLVLCAAILLSLFMPAANMIQANPSNPLENEAIREIAVLKVGEEVGDLEHISIPGENGGSGIEPEETEPEETEPEETETPDVPDDPNETKAPDVPGADKDDRYQQGSNGVWFIVGAAVLFGVLCMVVMIVVLTKKNKK